MAYRHCSGCGRAFDQRIWQRESFCGSCGESLKAALRREEPIHIRPYPDCTPPQKRGVAIGELLDELSEFAKNHPLWFSAGALAAGAGALMLGPGLVTLGQGVMMVGGILVAAGMLSVVFAEKEDATKLIAAGLLTLVAGTGIALVGYVLTVAGIVAVVAGSGVATKVAVQHLLRKRIEKQLRSKNVVELINLTRQLN
jgi:hypothetical protein